MQNLTGKQRKYLRSLAHSYKPHVIVGRNLLNDGTLHSIELTLTANELVKVKFPSKDEMNLQAVVFDEMDLFSKPKTGSLVAQRGLVDRVANDLLIQMQINV